jgi:hypothetical protein
MIKNRVDILSLEINITYTYNLLAGDSRMAGIGTLPPFDPFSSLLEVRPESRLYFCFTGGIMN